MNPNLTRTNKKRVVIIGAGFGGLQLAEKLSQQDDFENKMKVGDIVATASRRIEVLLMVNYN